MFIRYNNEDSYNKSKKYTGLFVSENTCKVVCVN